MKKSLLLSSFLMLFFATTLSAQTLEELKAEKEEVSAEFAAKQAEADALKAKIDGLNTQIKHLSGWRTGFSGLIGFDFNKSNNWNANPNPDATSTSLNIGITAFANRSSEKAFWNNKGIITKSWQDIDLSEGDMGGEDDNLFDNGTIDILNISSLAGYKLSDKFALSGLGELNTSIENFLDPGTFDIGVGATWLPVENMTVVIHPLNYRVAFSGVEGVSSEGALGAKVRMDYFKDFNLASKNLSWTTTFTSFVPYKSVEPTLFEWTWLNNVSFEIWKGIGVGIGLGLRNAEFESEDLQSFYTLGLSYNF